jgi:tRNA 2-thiouridine synthesizing protein A
MGDSPRTWVVAAEWDAGQVGCGELVLELHTRLQAMRPGQVLQLTALDAGAPADIPAWCRLTGHTLVSQQPPVYLIRRKET